MSPWFRRHKTEFPGKLIPFGALIDFLQTPAKENKQQVFAPRAVPGFFLGYHLHPTGKFKGEYLVISCADYRSNNCKAVQRVREVVTRPDGTFTFPLAEEIDPHSSSRMFRLSDMPTKQSDESEFASRLPSKDDSLMGEDVERRRKRGEDEEEPVENQPVYGPRGEQEGDGQPPRPAEPGPGSTGARDEVRDVTSGREVLRRPLGLVPHCPLQISHHRSSARALRLLTQSWSEWRGLGRNQTGGLWTGGILGQRHRDLCTSHQSYGLLSIPRPGRNSQESGRISWTSGGARVRMWMLSSRAQLPR